MPTVNTIVTYGFGFLCALMGILFYMQAHRTNTAFQDEFDRAYKRLEEAREKARGITRKAKQVALELSTKATLRQTEARISRITGKTLARKSLVRVTVPAKRRRKK